MLRGPNVVLRLCTEGDLTQLYLLENDYENRGEYLPIDFRTLPARKKQYEESQGWWDDKIRVLVITDHDGKILGLMAVFQRDPNAHAYEIGYVILRKEDRGCGYGTEALRIVTAYMFELRPIARLEIITDEGNVAARRIAEKCGFQYEGLLRDFWYVRGKYVNSVIYSLLRREAPPLADVLKPGGSEAAEGD